MAPSGRVGIWETGRDAREDSPLVVSMTRLSLATCYRMKWKRQSPSGTRINQLRVKQAQEVEPQVVASGCPYCLIMLEDGARARGVYESMPIVDVAELLERSLDGQFAAPPGA